MPISTAPIPGTLKSPGWGFQKGSVCCAVLASRSLNPRPTSTLKPSANLYFSHNGLPEQHNQNEPLLETPTGRFKVPE